jgi:hypothetical protein
MLWQIELFLFTGNCANGELAPVFVGSQARSTGGSLSTSTGDLTQALLNQLFENVAKEDLERITAFPLLLHEALWQMYNNGRAPIAPQTYTRLEDILADPVGNSTSSLEHRHVVKETAEFLDWLERVPS